MKTIFFILSIMIPGLAQATWAPSPAITCSAAEIYDAGYGITIFDSANGGYFGELSANSLSGGRSLGTEDLNIKAIRENGSCRLQITQVNDVDGNDMLIEIQAAQAGGRNHGKINMKLNGQPIEDMFSKLSCYIAQSTFNSLCKPSYDGGIYENVNNRSRSR
jgi:hypothetical protein